MLDETTFEIGNAKLKLREGLQFQLRRDGDVDWFLIEDESQGKFFRVGISEYTILSLLNGKRTLAEAIAITATRLGKDALNRHETARLSSWVIQSDLATTDQSCSFDRLLDRKQKLVTQHRMGWLNPIAVRLPLFNPDRILTIAERWLGMLVSWPVLLIWMIVVALGGICLTANWQTFFTGQIQSYSIADTFWVAVAWLGLKLIHEFSHGLVCKKFNGHVPQFGVLLLLLIPLPFVDVTSSWRFDNKWRRILTAAAGMMAELFVAAIAVIIWLNLDAGPLRFHVGNLIIAATVHTLLFNVNPLMRFDGYYMLADWLEIPNLYTRGSQHVTGKLNSWFFGSRSISESSRQKLIIASYGWATKIWMIMICFSLGLAAVGLFEGFGFLIAVVACIGWLVVPTVRLVRYLVFGTEVDQPNRVKFLAVSSGIVVAAVFLLTFVPAPSAIRLPVLVEYDPMTIVRSQSAGFVDQVLVQSGETVSAGQPIVQLRNRELEADLLITRIELKEAQIKAREFESEGLISDWQQQQSSVIATEKRLAELESLVDQLTLTSANSGIVLSRDLNRLRGRYVRPGTELIQVGATTNQQLKSKTKDSIGATAETHFKLIGLVDQDDAEWFRNLSQDDRSNVKVKMWGDFKSQFRTNIARVNPRTSDRVPHAAFAAVFQGPLSVVEDGTAQQEKFVGMGELPNENPAAGFRLTQPRLEIELTVPESAQSNLHAGQMGIAIYANRKSSLGGYLFDNTKRLIARSIKRTHGL